jgi:site-specific DNA recombinase
MTHTFCGKNKRNFYRYYRCSHAMKNGHDVCPTGTLPAGEIERVVIDEVRGLTTDEALLAQVLSDAHTAIDAELVAIQRDRDDLHQERKRHHEELQRFATNGKTTTDVTTRIADLHERLSEAERRLPELEARIAELECQTVTQAEARAALADFDALWESLIPREQARLLNLLISTVEYDGEAGTVSVTFRPTSIRSLIDRKLEDAA